MPPRHFVNVRRLSGKRWDADLGAYVVRGFGYIAECDCGEKSDRARDWRAARDWARAHTAAHPRGATVAVPVKP